ncbi:MAG: hypothetical protein JSV87_05860 [Candidatus Bathyarchaeota archaeon]|nr:MAG: hypothetical protein JSV87_05860 [Candidatus Bathyarchaeota archaeon]
MTTKWRPMMAIVYMIINLADFLIFPIIWSLLQIHGKGEVAQQWVPLTLSNGGLFHMAFGAVLGVAALTRGQEKIEKVKNANMDTQ